MAPVARRKNGSRWKPERSPSKPRACLIKASSSLGRKAPRTTNTRMVNNPPSYPPTPARRDALFTELFLASPARLLRPWLWRGASWRTGVGRVRSLRFLTILFVFLLLLNIPSINAAEPQLKAASQKTGNEVTLLSVDFRDANRGWAVGSSGKVLKTIDGGQKWKKQSSGTL